MTTLGWAPAPEPGVTGTVATAEVQDVPEPADVVAGWSGLIVIAALIVATGFLIRSMHKRLQRIDFDEGPDQEPGGPDDAPRPR